MIHLETRSFTDGDESSNLTNYVFAIHQNGEVNCYKGRLEKEMWSSTAYRGGGRRVLLARVTSLGHIRNGLLKSREDILTSLGAIENEEDKSVLILLTCVNDTQISKEAPKLALQIFNISTTEAATSAFGSKLREQVSLHIPQSDHLVLKKSAFALHIASGTLYQQTPGFVTVIDIAELLPKIVHEVCVGMDDLPSFLRLSSSMLAVARHPLFSLISLPYCSIQAESSTDAFSANNHGDLRLVSYFGPLKTMIAIDDRHLVAMQLPDTLSKSEVSRKRKREGTLVDSVGKGSYSENYPPFSEGVVHSSIRSLGTLLASSEDKAWKDQKARFDGYLSNGGLEALSAAMIQELEMQKPQAAVYIDQRKISYFLSRVFSVRRNILAKEEKPGNAMWLKITYLDRNNVFKWLLRKGFLTVYRVEDSLKENGSLSRSETLAPAAVIEAISTEDRSLGLLESIIASQTPLNPAELVSALAIVTQQLNSRNSSEDHKLLTDGESQLNQVRVKNNDYHNSPDNGLSDPSLLDPLHNLINLILTRLSYLPQPTITSTLRSHLRTPHLLTLIDILRLQIAQAGWFSPYDDALASATTSSTLNNHLALRVHLLNGTIDAIGVGGWILGSDLNDEMAETANTVSYMKAEISAALEGIEEAVYLQGMLGEVLLCGKDALKAMKIKDDPAVLPSKSAPKTIALQDEGIAGAALPLGLNLDEKVPLTKVGAGGELMGRSRRDIGRLKSRIVGKYSFERIVV